MVLHIYPLFCLVLVDIIFDEEIVRDNGEFKLVDCKSKMLDKCVCVKPSKDGKAWAYDHYSGDQEHVYDFNGTVKAVTLASTQAIIISGCFKHKSFHMELFEEEGEFVADIKQDGDFLEVRTPQFYQSPEDTTDWIETIVDIEQALGKWLWMLRLIYAPPSGE